MCAVLHSIAVMLGSTCCRFCLPAAEVYVPCSPSDPAALVMDLNSFMEQNLTDKVWFAVRYGSVFHLRDLTNWHDFCETLVV